MKFLILCLISVIIGVIETYLLLKIFPIFRINDILLYIVVTILFCLSFFILARSTKLKMNILKPLIIKNRIKYLSNCEDYIQIYFTDGAILNLYNKIKIRGDYNLFNDKIVNRFILNKKMLKIICSKDVNIEMSLKKDEYLTPEAFVYHGNDNKIIVG